MPDIDTLMQEWPPEFEELLKEVRELTQSGLQSLVYELMLFIMSPTTLSETWCFCP